MKSSWILVGVVVLLAIGAVAVFASQIAPQQIREAVQIPAITDTPIGGSGGNVVESLPVKTFDIDGRPFEFNPAEIRVKRGDVVRVTFRNMEGFHDWTLDEFNAKTKQIPVGESDTVEFVANKAGKFEYYCGVGNHRQMGMVGNLVVEE